MLRCQRCVGGRNKRDLEDEVIPCDFENSREDDGHDRRPHNTAKEQKGYPRQWFNGNGAVAWQDDKL